MESKSGDRITDGETVPSLMRSRYLNENVIREQLVAARETIVLQRREIEALRNSLKDFTLQLKSDGNRKGLGQESPLSPTSVVVDSASTAFTDDRSASNEMTTETPQVGDATKMLASIGSSESLAPQPKIAFRSSGGASTSGNRRRISSLTLNEELTSAMAPPLAMVCATHGDEIIDAQVEVVHTANGENGTSSGDLAREKEVTEDQTPPSAHCDRRKKETSIKKKKQSLVRKPAPLHCDLEREFTKVSKDVRDIPQPNVSPSGQAPPDHRLESEVTTKTSNISSTTMLQDLSDIVCEKSSQCLPPSHAAACDKKESPSPPCLVPPRRKVSPILQSCSPRSDWQVCQHAICDAWNKVGLYTGSIDADTLLPNGYGFMAYQQGEDGHSYAGTWKLGLYDGYGRLVDEYGDIYEGPFEHGIKQGYEDASMHFHDGRQFVGRFHNNGMREGVLQFPDGSSYEGLFKSNFRNGYGLYMFSNGDSYEGQWKDDEMHGRGRIDWNGIGAYVGEWRQGIQHGVGTEMDCAGNIVHQGAFFQGEAVVYAQPVDEASATTTSSI